LPRLGLRTLTRARHERDGLPPPEIYPHPNDVIIDEINGEVSFDGPMSKEQAGAQKVVTGDVTKNLSRFFEVKEALTQDPSNEKLRREFKELKKLLSFCEGNSGRWARHEALNCSKRHAWLIAYRCQSLACIFRNMRRIFSGSEFSGGKGKSPSSFLPNCARTVASQNDPMSGRSNLLSFAAKAPTRKCSVSDVDFILIAARLRLLAPRWFRRPETFNVSFCSREHGARQSLSKAGVEIIGLAHDLLPRSKLAWHLENTVNT
jgi:hypothetical protein